jgi:phosphatidylethanolamine-binding protein (PEBP) family uncharacterized protein
MAGTYTYGTAGETDKDTIRFLIQDTDPHNAQEWQVSDEEIQYVYDTWYPLYKSHEYVAAVLADTIAARYAREASYSADGVSVSLGPVGDQYRMLAASLREQHKSSLVGGGPDVGGMAPDEQLEPGTKPFSFGKGIHDNVEAGPQEYGGIYPPDQATHLYNVPEYEQVVEP